MKKCYFGKKPFKLEKCTFCTIFKQTTYLLVDGEKY